MEKICKANFDWIYSFDSMPHVYWYWYLRVWTIVHWFCLCCAMLRAALLWQEIFFARAKIAYTQMVYYTRPLKISVACDGVRKMHIHISTHMILLNSRSTAWSKSCKYLCLRVWFIPCNKFASLLLQLLLLGFISYLLSFAHRIPI